MGMDVAWAMLFLLWLVIVVFAIWAIGSGVRASRR
jgi:hypothetical protein